MGQSNEQPPEWEVVHTWNETKLSINQEQDAGNQSTDSSNEVEDVSSEAYTKHREPNDDQIYAKQNPFQATHFILLLFEQPSQNY